MNPDVAFDIVSVGVALDIMMGEYPLEGLVHPVANLKYQLQALVEVNRSLLLQVQPVEDLVVVAVRVELRAIGKPVVNSVIGVWVASASAHEGFPFACRRLGW